MSAVTDMGLWERRTDPYARSELLRRHERLVHHFARGYERVAVVLGTDRKAVDNALQRARRKLAAAV